MKANFLKLPDFVGRAIDFGALTSATNFSKMLKQDGCSHIEGVIEKDLEGSTELGVTSQSVRRSVRNFMAAVNGTGQPSATAEDGLWSLATALAVAESANSGKAVPVSIA